MYSFKVSIKDLPFDFTSWGRVYRQEIIVKQSKAHGSCWSSLLSLQFEVQTSAGARRQDKFCVHQRTPYYFGNKIERRDLRVKKKHT